MASYRKAILFLAALFSIAVLIGSGAAGEGRVTNRSAGTAHTPLRDTEAIIDKHLSDWPAEARASYLSEFSACLGRYPGTARNTAWIELLVRDLETYVERLPRWKHMSPERLELKLAYLRWRVTAFLENGPPSGEQKKALIEQVGIAVDFAERWCEDRVGMLPLRLRKGALERFRSELLRTVGDTLATEFQKPLPSEEQTRILDRWQDYFDTVDIEEETRAFVVMPDRAESVDIAPDKDSDLITTIYRHFTWYYRERKTLVDKPGYLTAAYQNWYQAEVVRLRNEQAAFERELAEKRLRQRYASSVQSYEVLSVLFDAALILSDRSPWLPQTVAAAMQLAPSFGVSDANSQLLLRCDLRYEDYGGFGPEGTLSGDIAAIIAAEPGSARVEIVGHSPSWRTRGLLYEPVGLTMFCSDDEVNVYHPALSELDTGRSASGVSNQGFSGLHPQKVPPVNIELVLRNKLRFLNASADFFQPSGIEISRGAAVAAGWSGVPPYLYEVPLKRAVFEPSGDSDCPLPFTRAEFWTTDADKPAEAIEVHREHEDQASGKKGGFLVDSRVFRQGLVLPCSETSAYSDLTIARPRVITWRLEKSEAPGAESFLPSYCEIRDGEGRLLLVCRCSLLGRSEAGSIDLRDVKSPLPQHLGSGLAWKYCRSLKRYHVAIEPAVENVDRTAMAHLASEVEQGLLDARRVSDWEMVVAFEHLLMDCVSWQRDSTRRRELALRHVKSVAEHCDEIQYDRELQWALNRSVWKKWASDARELQGEYKQNIASGYTAQESLDLGQAYMDSADFFLASALFGVAAEKATDSRQRHKAHLSLAHALAELAACLENQFKWPKDECLGYRDEARIALETYLNDASSKERAEDALVLRRIRNLVE